MAWVEGPAQQQEGSGTRPTQHRPGLQHPGLLLLVSPWPLPGAHPAPSAAGAGPVSIVSLLSDICTRCSRDMLTGGCVDRGIGVCVP